MSEWKNCPLCRKGPVASEYFGARNVSRFECQRCGTYFADPFLGKILDSEMGSPPARHLLSAATRKASDAGGPLTLTPDSVSETAAGVVEPRGVLDKLDRLIALIAEGTTRIGYGTRFQPSQDYPLGPFLDEEEVESLLEFAEDRGWFLRNEGTLTLQGWARADELRAHHSDSRIAFVAMAFAPELHQAWIDGFRPGIEASRYYSAARIDEVQHNGKICDAIVAELRRASLVVVDVTNFRPSVFFEAGWAYGLGTPVIWTCRKDQSGELASAFDTRQYNHILWESPQDLALQLDQRIRATALPSDVLRNQVR